MQEQEQTTAQWLFPKIFAVIIAVFVVGFGVQTYFLVDALMPADQMLMKCLTVFAFDGCALIYFVAKAYYPFRSEKSLHATQVMFRVTFAGSAACTVIWMILNADHFNWSLVPSPLVFAAYVLVTFAVTINVLVFYYMWEQENAAKHVRTPKKASEPLRPAQSQVDIEEVVSRAITQKMAAIQPLQQQALPAPVLSEPSHTEEPRISISQAEYERLRGAAASPLPTAAPKGAELNGK